MVSSLYNWIGDNAVTIISFISILLSLLSFLIKDATKIINWISWGVLFLVIVLFNYYALTFIVIFPPSIVPFVVLLISIFIAKSKDKIWIKRYSLIQYIILILFLLLGMELAKTSANTWGASSVYVGIFIISLVVPLKFLTRGFYNRNLIYGILELLVGLISAFIIIIKGFSDSEYNAEDIDTIRDGVVFLTAVTILDGVLLIYKTYKKSTTSNSNSKKSYS